MRLLAALALGLLIGIIFAVGFGYLLAWNARRLHPEAMMVAVGLVPTVIAFIVGFGVGVFWVIHGGRTR